MFNHGNEVSGWGWLSPDWRSSAARLRYLVSCGLLIVGACLPHSASAQTRTLRALNVTAVSRQDFVVPVQFVAQGNENSLGFSLVFDPALITYRGAVLGAVGSGSQWNANTNQATSGRVGFVLARGAGQTFAAGTGELLRLQFSAGVSVQDVSVTFGDAPVVREIADASASPLTTLFENGLVTVTPLLKPTFLSQPQDVTVYAGSNLVLNAWVSGSVPMFAQWQRDGAPIPSLTNLFLSGTSNSLSQVFVLTNVSQTGSYRVVATNAGGSATSSVARVIVLPALIPPAITLQPVGKALSAGETMSLRASATGSPPLSYQWRLNNSDLSGATNETLVLSTVPVSAAGNYSVVVRNLAGTVSSQNALVSVSANPRLVRLGSANVASGATIEVPVNLLGFGDENSIGFSLGFDPTRLSFLGVSAGSDATGGSLLVNTNDVRTGRVGLAVGRPAGQVFAAGQRTILTLRFLAGGQSGTNFLTVGDSPIARDLADVLGDPRPVTFEPASINILSTPPSIVSAPQGTNMPIFGSTTLAVAALGSTPLGYQWRFNGAPIAGAVQTTLSLTGLLPSGQGDYDVIVANAVASVTSSVARVTVPRVVRWATTNGPTGTPIDVPLELLSAGDENSLGFSFRFDTNRLAFRELLPGRLGTDVILNLNTNLASAGTLGIAMSLLPPAVFARGTQQVAVLRFIASTVPGGSSLAFADSPIFRELSDANAQPKLVSFQDGGVGTAHIPPTITQQPVALDVASQASATFQVAASGSLPMTFQWSRNGIVLPRATAQSLVIPSAEKVDEGNYSVEVRNLGGSAFSTPALLRVNPPDTNGPTFTFASFDSRTLTEGAIISKSGTLSVTAVDLSGVSRVEFYIDDQLLVSDNNGSDGFSAFWNIELISDGPRRVSFRGYDTKNNLTTLSTGVTVTLAAPPAPVIGLPLTGTVVSDPQVRVRGTGPPNTSVQLYRNGQRIGVPIPVPLNGIFEGLITVAEGTNRVQAVSLNRAGEGAFSPEVVVILDTSIPTPALGLGAESKDGGRILLGWLPSIAPAIRGYHLYRASSPVTNKTQAIRLTSAPIDQLSFQDVPPSDGKYYYSVSTINPAGTEGPLSTSVASTSDRTPPSALSVRFSSESAFDAITGPFGRGVVNVVLTMSEPLKDLPFLSITPAGGLPITVELRAGPNNQYTGAFAITEETPTGTASVLMTARDLVGNRGSEIQNGSTVSIDTAGPDVITLAIAPSRSLRNDSNAPVVVSFVATLSERLRSNSLPQFSYFLTRSNPSNRPVAAITQSNATTWLVSFPLPRNAGLPAERLELQYRGQDDLGNLSTRIEPVHDFEVYQGALPKPEIPRALVAKAIPAGAIHLQWQLVPQGVAYEIYRKGSSEAAFTWLTRLDPTTNYVDIPPIDGRFTYQVASVRQENGQESISDPSDPDDAIADRVSPPAPTGLDVTLASNGAFLQWKAPANLTEPVTYYLYRTNRGPVLDITKMSPLIRIPLSGVTQVVDPSPTPAEPYYGVAAVDQAGNLSAISSSAYLNAELLPVRTLTVTQTDLQPPVISWTQAGSTVQGHDFYLGEDGALSKLNTGGLIRNRTFTDTTYAGDDRRYTVVAVDLNQQQSLGRSLRLPRLTATLDPDAVVKRGLMNRLTYVVRNDSAYTNNNVQLRATLGNREHVSLPFSIAPGEVTNIVVVGGYSYLPDGFTTITNTIEVRPQDGEQISFVRSGRIAVGDGQLIVSIVAANLLRGGNARVQFSLMNPSTEEIEIISAAAGGTQASPSVRFSVLDSEGHLLSAAPFKSTVGQGIINLANGNSVLRLKGGADALSAVTTIPIPSTAPDRILIRVEIDKVYYHSDGEDRVEMDGVQTRQEFPIIETSYTAEVTDVTPAQSNDDQPIEIRGVVRYRRTATAAPNVPLLVKIANGGFERSEQVLSESDGSFKTVFEPLPGESGGIYSVWAVHPDLNDRTVQKTFVIKRVLVSPAQFTVQAPFGFEQPVRLSVTAGPGTSSQNVRVEYRPEDQRGGSLPAGVVVNAGKPITTLDPGQTGGFDLTFLGNTLARNQPDGILVLRVTSDDAGPQGWQKVQVTYHFSEATPRIVWDRSFIDTGVSPTNILSTNAVNTGISTNNSVTETIVFENKGLVSATNLFFTLVNLDGTPAPAWASLTVNSRLSELKVGEKYEVGMRFAPPVGTTEGDYNFYLRVRAGNAPPIDLFAHVAVVNSGRGDVAFKVLDMYSGVLQTNQSGTYRLEGVGSARIRLQNEEVTSWDTNLVTDARGEALFANVPAGRYKFSVAADKHNSSNGRLWVRAGTTVNQQVALTYTLVSVEWEVVPITIQDRYEIVLQATFETDVPAPVVTIEPAAVNLPQMVAGDVYYGEFVVFNHGLIRADHFSFGLPASDTYLNYELLAGVPEQLNAKQKLRVPFRITCRKSLPGAQSASTPPPPPSSKPQLADTSPEDCFRYGTLVLCHYDYICINGLLFPGGASSCYHYQYSRGCPGSTGGGGPPVFGGGGGGGGGYTYSPGGQSVPGGPECYPDKKCEPKNSCDTSSCDCVEHTGSWVGLIAREYQDEAEDLKVKVPGGYVSLTRQFYHGAWHWANIDRRLVFATNGADLSGIERNLAQYAPQNSARTVFESRGLVITKEPNGWRWREQDGAWEFYDLSGRLQSSGNRNITLALYVYDAADLPLGINDRTGRRLITFERTGRELRAVRDFTGRTVQYQWSNARLVKVIDVLNQPATYAYDGAGRMVQKTDVNGRTLNITHNGGGYVYSVLDTNGVGKFFQFSYDKNLKQYYAQVKTSEGQVKETRLNSNGDVVEKIQNGIREKNVVRDGRTEVHTSASGGVTRRELDEHGYVIREVHPDGGLQTWEREPLYHQPTRMADPRGAITLLEYDRAGNLTNRIEAAGTPIARTNSWVYNADNLMIRRIDGRRNAMDYTYDANGNLTREFDPQNPAYQTTYDYDASGNRVGITNALGYVTRFGFDGQGRQISQTNALNYVSLYTYVGKNLVQAETGRDGTNRGRIVRYHYDGEGRRIQTIRVDEKDVEHVWETTTYDGDGRVVAVANAVNQTTRYEYDTGGRRSKVIRPFSATETSDLRFVYDEFGRLYQEIDPLGVITQHEYDEQDREHKVTEAWGTELQRSRLKVFDLNNNLISISYSDGTNALTTYYAYDLLNRRVEISGAREYPTRFEYDRNDNIQKQVNARGNATLHTFDQYNRRTNVIVDLSSSGNSEHSGSFIYNATGQLLTSIDGNGNRRHFISDALGRGLAETIAIASSNALPADSIIESSPLVKLRWKYNPWGQPVYFKDVLGGNIEYTYDSFGRLHSSSNNLGKFLIHGYDAIDNLITVNNFDLLTPSDPVLTKVDHFSYDHQNSSMLTSTVDGDGVPMLYEYDRRFLPVRVWNPTNGWNARVHDALKRVSTVRNSLNEQLTIQYDIFDQAVKIIYPGANIEQGTGIEFRAYDAFGRVIRNRGAVAIDFDAEYDSDGNILALINLNTNRVEYSYDGKNRLVSRKFLDGTSYEYSYDANGNLLSRIDPQGLVTRYSYDPENNLRRVLYPNGNESNFDYDLMGRRVFATTGMVSNRWCYDEGGRIVCESSHYPSRNGHTNWFKYDFEGRRTYFKTPHQTEISYSYTAGGRLIRSGLIGGKTLARYSYSDAGTLETCWRSSGMESKYLYDPVGRIQKIRHGVETNGTIEIDYGYDRRGFLVSRSVVGSSLPSDVVHQFEIDDRIRVRQVNGVETGSEEFGYDVAGNLIYSGTSQGRQSFQLNSLNQVTNLSAATIEYSLGGGVTSKGKWRYGWDSEFRLTSVRDVDRRDGAYWIFAYDALGRCFKRELGVMTNDGWTPLKVSFIYYDGWNVVLVTDTKDSEAEEFHYGVQQSGPIAVTTSTGFVDLLTDSVGSTVAAADGSGAILETYAYSAFGMPRVYGIDKKEVPTSTIGVRHLFHGSEFLSELGLSDHRYRYYSPEFHRWLSADPIVENGFWALRGVPGAALKSRASSDTRLRQETTYSDFDVSVGRKFRFINELNLYVFAANNPTTYVDTHGLDVTLETGNNAPWYQFLNNLVHQQVCVDEWSDKCNCTEVNKWTCCHAGKTCFSFAAIGFQLPQFSSTWLGWPSSVVGASMEGMIYSVGPVGGASIINRHSTTMDQDRRWQAYVAGRVGTTDAYSVGRHNCRAYSQAEFDEAPSHW